jgi:thiol-disulfide isomerase/thioredoxin|tara:strand:+ start:138 stop:665 length:528 start_codon:yes stop_codon:yes gene_type:complete
MKISKSFKIYIHIIFALSVCQYLYADTDFSKNIVIHEKPLNINELKFKDFNLQDVDLTNKKGNIMILNFWASWCAPCKREMPSLEKLTENYPKIKIYPINMEKPNKIRAGDFYKSIGITSLEIYFDPELKLVKKFKMRGLPTSILIDKNGKEFGRVVGEIDFYNKEFIELLKKYI